MHRRKTKKKQYALEASLAIFVVGCVFLMLTMSSSTGQVHQTQAENKEAAEVAAVLPKRSKKVAMPSILYGTAWKKEDTGLFVRDAIMAGFTGIDTACQPRHYQEDLVGQGIVDALKEINEGEAAEGTSEPQVRSRGDLFIQTKFTPPSGQDEQSTPYDRDAPIATQVEQSLNRSLHNLQTTYLNAWLLHSPYDRIEDTMEAYHAMENLSVMKPLPKMGWLPLEMEVNNDPDLIPQRRVLQLGVSNVYDVATFKRIYEGARQIKPTVIQNRFTKEQHYSPELRTFCLEKKIQYQTFWTLTGNRKDIFSTTTFREAFNIARRSDDPAMKQMTETQFWFGYLISIGITPLAGPKNPQHMREDVDIIEKKLPIKIDASLSEYHKKEFKSLLM